MRLSEWQQAAPTVDAMNDRVLVVLESVLVGLGAEPDPECWVAWGEDPERKYSILTPTSAGLINVAVRPTTPVEGPRATAKLIRWSKVAVGELSLEATGGYRMVAVQVEGLVIKGTDEEADRICAFVRVLIAGTDGRGHQMTPVPFMGALPGAPVPTAGRAAAPPATPRKAPAVVPPVLPAGKSAAQPEPAAVADAAAASKAAPARSAKATLAKTPAAAPLEVPSAPVAPAAPVAPVAPVATAAADATVAAPRPIAARAAKASATPEPSPDGKEVPSAPAEEDVDPDRSRWVGPHAIGDEQARRQDKPRWMP